MRKKHKFSIEENLCIPANDFSEALALIDQQHAENERLKKVVIEWVLHHYSLDVDDKVAGESHSCCYCWQISCDVLGIECDDESVKHYLEQALKENK